MSVTPAERLIVALDVPTQAEARQLVEDLDGLITFFKVGLELFMGGGVESLLRELAESHRLFADLKLPDDIPATVTNVVRVAAASGVTFLTLSHSAGPDTIAAALRGRGTSRHPQLLFVPFLSSQDDADFARRTGRPAAEFQTDLLARATEAKAAGADGFIVSGREIALLRKHFPDAVLVSPGIRPGWSAADDHKRSSTPAEAIRFGADYIVVGRPIRKAGDRAARRDAAKRVIDEVALSLTEAR
jgi:orotidine-5'-phosphate decarboxylase